MAEVIVAGHICLDVIPALVGGAELIPGRMIQAGPVTLATGGAVANTGLALHRLGVSTVLAGMIGDDLFGQAIRERVEANAPGLSSGLIITPGSATSYTIVLNPPNIDRMFIHSPGCNATFGADHIGQALLDDVRLLHFGYPQTMAHMYQNNGAELRRLFLRARTVGAAVALDLTIPDPHGPARNVDWRALLEAILPGVDICLPGVEELLLAVDRERLDALRVEAQARGCTIIDCVTPALLAELADMLLALGVGVVGLKLGHRGIYLRTGTPARLGQMGRAAPDPQVWAERELWAPAFVTEVAGTTGAGDAAIAGFLMGLVRGWAPEATLTAACAVGACCVEAADALSGVQSWPKTAARIASGWKQHWLEPGPSWRWDATTATWIGPRENNR